MGETVYEVPVGFKHISAKMAETGAIIGGESSGGLAVQGHISGKDGIYAAALLVEMLAVTGKTLSELYREITQIYGVLHYADDAFTMTRQRKEELLGCMEIPDFGNPVARISREDGCKVYFADGSWVICRFSGTEPLLRMAAEAPSKAQAEGYITRWREALRL